MFLVSLAVADLLLVAVCAPLETMGYFLNPWTRDGSLCQLQSYVEMLSAVASVLNLTAVSLERYHSGSSLPSRRLFAISLPIWLIELRKLERVHHDTLSTNAINLTKREF